MAKVKIIGKRTIAPLVKGFTPELEGFLKLCMQFRASSRYIPSGVYRFKSFEEANEWNMKMLLSGEKTGTKAKRRLNSGIQTRSK